jgi:hypothetical protein
VNCFGWEIISWRNQFLRRERGKETSYRRKARVFEFKLALNGLLAPPIGTRGNHGVQGFELLLELHAVPEDQVSFDQDVQPEDEPRFHSGKTHATTRRESDIQRRPVLESFKELIQRPNAPISSVANIM